MAGAVTSLLVRAAFAAGVTAPFLMPAEDGMRIHMRAGLRGFRDRYDDFEAALR
ncbi:MAG: hypothetical protein U0232_17595 [Thermomicrobiales bacterium]